MSELFLSLAVLACPLGMGLMMWMMMRGGKSKADPEADNEAELGRMRAEIDQLRGEQYSADTSSR